MGQLTSRVFWITALAAAVVLGAVVAIPQHLSKQARLEVLRSHVAQTARLGAGAVDGDLHRTLLDPANYTPALFDATLAPLVRFHNAAPEVFYVYTMVERGGRSYFVLDTAASSELDSPHPLLPSDYMEEFVELETADPDWLQRIAAGETYVYPHFQRDPYGVFLSGHAPIYDSEGRYSGFVGVDYDLGYYLAQEASFRSIFIGTLAAALLLSLLIGYLAARYDHQAAQRLAEHHRLSITDELTGLLNRRGAYAAVTDALKRQAAFYAAVLIDVDDLKGVNDAHGHAAGDAFLLRVADAMRSSVRENDICARLGGDEFLVFAVGCDLDAATEIARRILARVHGLDIARDAYFGVSIGVSISSGRSAVYQEMYRQADEALYRAKAAGRNRYVIAQTAAA